jgi:DNA-binding NtrC family response regulator
MTTILIVDDDQHIRRTLRALLTRYGHEVLEAADGVVAMEHCRLQVLDLVITDLFMPEKDGLELLLELRALRPNLPIITMSGGAATKSLDLLADTRMLGAVRTVAKPFTIDEMRQAVEAVLMRPRRVEER